MKIKDAVEQQIGYRPFETFYETLSIAERYGFGLDAIQDIYNRTFDEWKNNYKYLTELVLLLGLKISEHYGKNNEYANLYDKLFHQTQEYALEYLQDEELKFFVETTG